MSPSVLLIFLFVLFASCQGNLHKTIQADLVVIPNDYLGFEEEVTYPVVGVNTLAPATYTYGQDPTNSSKVRIVTAGATVTHSTLNTGSETTTTTRAWARSQGISTDDAGHILANRLGGSGKEPVNIFPQSPTINRGVYRMFEAKIAECINATNITANLKWSFNYDDTARTTRPTSVYYCVDYSHGCENTCDTFPN